MTLPVIRALQERSPGLECILLALTNGYARARTAGLQPLGYKDFLHLVDAQAAVSRGRLLAAGNESPDVSKEESEAYLGINYLDLESQLGPEGAAALYAEKGRYAFLPLHFMRRLVQEVAPDVVVATNSPRSEEASLAVAADLGIPSVAMVDLFGMDSDTFVLRSRKPGHTCVIAPSVRDRLLQRDFPPERVHVTGNPAFDGLFAATARQQAQEFLARRGWQGKQVILYIGAWEPVAHPATPIPPGRSFPIEVEALLRRYVADRPGAGLIVRYHPGDWFQYPRGPEGSQVHFSEPPSEAIHPLILASSVVVTANSTVGLEAAVAGKPVVSIENSPAVHHWFSLAKLGVAYPSPTHLDLPATLDEVLAHGRPLRAFQSDGRAAERVADVIQAAMAR